MWHEAADCGAATSRQILRVHVTDVAGRPTLGPTKEFGFVDLLQNARDTRRLICSNSAAAAAALAARAQPRTKKVPLIGWFSDDDAQCANADDQRTTAIRGVLCRSPRRLLPLNLNL